MAYEMTKTKFESHGRSRLAWASSPTEVLGDTIQSTRLRPDAFLRYMPIAEQYAVLMDSGFSGASSLPLECIVTTDPSTAFRVGTGPGNTYRVTIDVQDELQEAWHQFQNTMLVLQPSFFALTALTSGGWPYQIEHEGAEKPLIELIAQKIGAVGGRVRPHAPQLEQEYEIHVSPSPISVRKVTGRVVRRTAAKPNPILD